MVNGVYSPAVAPKLVRDAETSLSWLGHFGANIIAVTLILLFLHCFCLLVFILHRDLLNKIVEKTSTGCSFLLCRSPNFLVTCYRQGLSIEAWPWPLYLTMTSQSDHASLCFRLETKVKSLNCCMIDRITHDLWCDFDSAHDNFCFLSPELRQSVINHDQPFDMY